FAAITCRTFAFFPTRRSSDLQIHDQAIVDVQRWQADSRSKRKNCESRSVSIVVAQWYSCPNCTKSKMVWQHPHHHSDLAAKVPRSEEHTSELQSRFDLVCRLL